MSDLFVTGDPTTGPFLVSTDTVDSPSTNANCVYSAAALGGTPLPDVTVYSGGAPITIIPPGHICAPVSASNLNFPPVPSCIPARSMPSAENCVNKTVRINGVFPCVSSTPPLGGDESLITAFPTPSRPLTGPFQCPTIIIGSQIED